MMKAAVVVVVFVGVVGSGASSAVAQTVAQAWATAPDPTVSPGFVAIDRFDADSRAGIQMSYLRLESPASSSVDMTLLRFEARARYVHKPSGVGGYVQVPFAYANASQDGMSDTVTDLGNIEFGGMFASRITPELGMILRAGITLPTGEDGEEALVGTIANVFALPDFYNSLPQATTIKLGVSPVVRKGIVFARLDLGLSWNVDSEDVVAGKGFHFNAGAGIDLGSGAVMIESENLSITNDDELSDDSTTLNVLAVSARGDFGTVLPYAALLIPLDEDISESFEYAVTLGAEFRIP